MKNEPVSLLLRCERIDEVTTTERSPEGRIERRQALRASLVEPPKPKAAGSFISNNYLLVDLPIFSSIEVGQMYELKPASS